MCLSATRYANGHSVVGMGGQPPAHMDGRSGIGFRNHLEEKKMSSKDGLLGGNPKEPSDETDLALARKFVVLLNGMLKQDHQAIQCLVDNRIPCNAKLANHDTVQTLMTDNGFSVGVLGVLNGMCGVTEDGLGHIMATYTDDSIPVLTGFVINEP